MARGFLLFELLLYLTIFSFIVMISFHAVSALHLRYSSSVRRSNWLLSLYAAQDCIRRELEEASLDELWEKRMYSDELVFSSSGYRVVFKVSKDRLIRVKEALTSDRHASKSTYTVSEHIEKIHFSYDWDRERLRGIEVELVGDSEHTSYILKHYIRLKNRVLNVNEKNNIAISSYSETGSSLA